MATLDKIRSVYPGAITTQDAVDRMLAVFKRELGLEPAQIVHADSICADDLNAIEYPQRAYEMLGPFNLGGLNGFPFAGLTGMGAFTHHVPEDGAIFIFHAPHIGITNEGKVGATLRPGQSEPSTCCGAAQAALGKLQRGELKEGQVDELDYQQNTLEQILLRSRDRVLAAATPILAATEVIYEAIEERIDLLLARTSYGCKSVIVMGGVLINGDHGEGSYCEVRRFLHLDPNSGKRSDWRALLE